MTDDYKLQASYKFGPGGAGMLNVRGGTGEEFRALLSEATGSCGEMAVLAEALNTEFASVSVIAAAFPGTTVQPQQFQTQGAAQAGGNNCQHGAMVFKEGADWKGWFCPAQKTDPSKCKARYIR